MIHAATADLFQFSFPRFMAVIGGLALSRSNTLRSYVGRWLLPVAARFVNVLPRPSWFGDYRDVRRLYQRLSLWSEVYLVLRFLICPFRRIESAVPQSGVVVDIGCGYGLFANLLAIRSDARRVFAYDIDARRIEVASLSVADRNNIEFFNNATGAMPYCEAVTMIDVVHHISAKARAQALKKIAERLRPDGYLIIKDIDKTPRAKYLWNYVHDLLMTRFQRCDYLGQNEMCELLKQVGFTVVVEQIQTHTPYSHVLYRCKKINPKRETVRLPRFAKNRAITQKAS